MSAAPRATWSSAGSGLPEPASEDAATVERVVTGPTGPSALTAPARPDEDATTGRWGPAPVRPQLTGILVEELRGGWRMEAGNEEAAALAVIAAHAWVDALRDPADASRSATGRPATGAIVAIEAVERPGAHHAVVTVLVAHEGPRGRLLRIAFPVVFGPDGPAIAGAPWMLPPPTAEDALSATRPLQGTPVGDPSLIASARMALDAVGIPGDRLVALEATDGWPFIARLDDEAPAHPWLRWHLDRFVVTGLPLVRAGSASASP